MKKCKEIGLPSLTAIAAALAAMVLAAHWLTLGTYAWWKPFGANFSNEDVCVTASIRTNYFESGTGTEDDPYIIHTPAHLYNLAWLQYLGFFNQGSTVYFELCDGDNTWAKENSDSGISGGVLDMTGYTLPPIGNSEYPFLGHFDGNGVTIQNLTVSNSAATSTDLTYFPINAESRTATGGTNTDWEPETDSQYMGVFGVVGPLSGEADSTNTVRNVFFDDVTVTSSTAKTTVGIAAGYVNAKLENVGIIDSGISVTNTAAQPATGTNLSDYTLVGYCTEAYLDEATLTDVRYATPTVTTMIGTDKGKDGEDWGASVDIKEWYERLEAAYNEDNGL